MGIPNHFSYSREVLQLVHPLHAVLRRSTADSAVGIETSCTDIEKLYGYNDMIRMNVDIIAPVSRPDTCMSSRIGMNEGVTVSTIYKRTSKATIVRNLSHMYDSYVKETKWRGS
jgi:hypothetical protein